MRVIRKFQRSGRVENLPEILLHSEDEDKEGDEKPDDQILEVLGSSSS